MTDMGPLVLGIETATRHGGVALCSGGKVVGELLLFNPRTHSERLLPSVDLLLDMSGLQAGELAAVAVSIGPGSFTGLRIGVAAAKGLAFSLAVPLFGVPTMDALAAAAPAGKDPVCTVIDARRGEVFTALFRTRGGRLVKSRKERTMTPDELTGSLPEGTLLVGDVPPALLESPGRRGKRSFRTAPSLMNIPRAASVALLGGEMLAQQRPSETGSLVPLYIRPSDAEANRRKGTRSAGGRRTVRRSSGGC